MLTCMHLRRLEVEVAGALLLGDSFLKMENFVYNSGWEFDRMIFHLTPYLINVA
jgi:hypothetical protein